MIKDVDQPDDSSGSGKEDKIIKDTDQNGDDDQSTSGKDYIKIKDDDLPGQENGMLKVIPLILYKLHYL